MGKDILHICYNWFKCESYFSYLAGLLIFQFTKIPLILRTYPLAGFKKRASGLYRKNKSLIFEASGEISVFICSYEQKIFRHFRIHYR